MDPQILYISSFKNFALKLILPFVVICFVIGFLINYFFEQKIVLGNETSGTYKVNRIIQEYHPLEVAFFGSSRAEGSFIIDSLVQEGFNYGIAGIQDDVVLFFAKEECSKKGKTTPLIINFDLHGFAYNLGDKSNYIYNVNYLPLRNLLDSNYKAIYRVPLLKYYGSFDTYVNSYLNSRMSLTKYTSKGSIIDKSELTHQKFDQLVQQRLREKSVFYNNEKLQADFLEMIDQHKNRTFIFVVAPYHASVLKSIKNREEADTFFAFLKKRNNVVVLDFSKVHYPDGYFLNTTHLNYKGAIAFNQVLKDSLAPYLSMQK